ncbi:MAG TPA: GIY-YIG nuclease family protein [Phycisphaerales bacterium]|nr:GIY-YIG nuclease family protein [Phycisphaerales bacterium]
MRQYYVYILAGKRNGTLYTGMTHNLIKRVGQHKEGRVAGFTKEYGVKRLVWYTTFENVWDAIAAEKRIKKWKRRLKLRLIERVNREWDDLIGHQVGGRSGTGQ